MANTKKTSSKSKGEIVLRFKKEDILTVLFIISVLITIFCGIKAYIRSEESKKTYENYLSAQENSQFNMYVNDEMSFTINYPKTWGYQELDDKLSKAI